jgi:hypothetical protein
MAPFHTDQLTSPAVSASGSPMEEVLALQSYSVGSGGAAEFCISDRSIEIICPSGISGSSELAL